ncbi:MAG: FAD-binding protein [Eubacteriales bacterium]|nr:FAD-binding protein [Eubacteriales bacterium]
MKDSNMSRRQFLKGFSAGAAGLALSAALPKFAVSAEENKENGILFEDTIAWNAVYDTVIIGFGGAGATAAIEAHDQGLKTIVIEKAPQGLDGGNTHYSSQRFLHVNKEDKEKMVEYMKEVRGLYTDNMSDEIIEYLVDGFTDTLSWFESIGGQNYELKNEPEYPDFVNSDVVYKVYTGDNYNFWPVLRRAAFSRRDENLEIWFNSPCLDLIQDPFTKRVLGVKVQHDGEELNLRASKGVILAAGGFEANNEMIQDYVQLPYAIPLGSHYNTGEVIKMAQKCGADLWHMSATSGPFLEFKNPRTGYAYRQLMGTGKANFVKDTSAVFVGADGTRFMSETTMLKHGHVMFHGLFIRVPISLPAFCVFDEKARLERPLYRVWSDGMEKEIEEEWILKGDTLEELAEKIGVPAEGLVQGIADWNTACENGVDPLGRQEEYLHAFGEGPYYAFPLTPAFINTQGGPARNTACEVLNTDREPIPGLYSASEIGSFYSSKYQGAGNLAECIVTGRTAVKSLMAAKIEEAPIVLTEAEQPAPYVAEVTEKEIECGENQYIGTGYGVSEIKVRVTMDGEKIANVEVVSNMETPGIADGALQEVGQRIVDTQSTEVDMISGATRTTKGIIEAVNDALSQVK